MLEIITSRKATHARVALFDFDGTLSLIRAGWMEVMVPMMTEELHACKSGESDAEIEDVVREFVGRLTGKQTIYQMIALVEAIESRGGTAKDAVVYKKRYLDLLQEKIKDRLDALESGSVDPDTYAVPGSRNLLDGLKARGFKMFLASGTDQDYMRHEADLLGFSSYFDGGVFGALDDYKSFSKKILIERIIANAEFKGEEFLGFGDGYVEIENVHQVGGVTVGVATDEPDCAKVDEWKRDRLVKVGADYVVPHYRQHGELFAALFD
ncbi:MAG: HAD hydrolase-like protein [Bryobacterales bacterium]|nr:HAD hydrolase-like protein [Bryobacterales bacterium]